MPKVFRALALKTLALALWGCSSSTEAPTAQIVPDIPSACEIRGEAGTCEGLIMGYEFNPDTGQCQDFFWGGCEGVLPFATLEDCQTACES